VTYRFKEVPRGAVCRVCRKTVKTDQLDIVPDPYYASLADKVVQAGLMQFPDSAFLNIVYASLQAVLLNDPSVGDVANSSKKQCSICLCSLTVRCRIYIALLPRPELPCLTAGWAGCNTLGLPCKQTLCLCCRAA